MKGSNIAVMGVYMASTEYFPLTTARMYGIFYLSRIRVAATRRSDMDKKAEILKNLGALTPHPEGVKDPLFREDPFFDARDWVQVKYEMLRRVQQDGCPVSDTATAFGVSRPTFYQTKKDFEKGGLPGLIPQKRGPRGRHKLTPKVVRYVQEARSRDPALKPDELVTLIKERFGTTVHRRTIQRGIAREQKKGRRTT